MKKLFFSIIILTTTSAVAIAQKPAAKAQTPKLHLVVNTATSNSENLDPDWVSYKQQLISDQQKKVMLNAVKLHTEAKTTPPRKNQTGN